MAAKSALKNYYTFSKGLVTDANQLLGAENSCSEMSNVLIGGEGENSARKALALLGSALSIESVPTGTDELGTRFSYAVAESVEGDTAGSARLALYVGGQYIFIFNIEDPEVPTLEAEVPVPTTSTGYSLSAGRGVFCATSGDNDPLIIRKNNGTYTHFRVVLFERDFVGIDDGYPINERPTVLTDDHRYNLLNQGWNDTDLTTVAYPSNSDVWAMGLRTNVATGIDEFNLTQLQNYAKDAGPAPRGHFVRSVFDQNDFGNYIDYGPSAMATATHNGSTFSFEVYDDWTSAPYGPTNTGYTIGDSITIAGCGLQYREVGDKSEYKSLDGTYAIASISYNATTDRTTIGVSSVITNYLWTWNVDFGRITSEDVTPWNPQAVVETARPRCSAFFAGRLWFSGITPNTNYKLQSAVFFSQVLEDISWAGKCFQQGDPTARQNNEIVDTDGGSIIVSEMGTVLQMLVVNESLLLFAENGVWAISGSDGVFSPTKYSVRKVSTRGVKSGLSAVLADNACVYYSNRAVYAIVQDETMGFLSSKKISDQVDSWFEDVVAGIDESLISLAYDAYSHRVLVCFNTEKEDFGADSLDILAIDLKNGAYMPWLVSNEYVSTTDYTGICGAVSIVNSFTVKTPVVFPVIDRDGSSVYFKFYSMHDDTAVADAHIANGDYTSYMKTTVTVLDSAIMKKQMPRVGVYMKRQADASLKMQGRFNWSNSGASGKWGTKQECYYERGAEHDVCWRTLSVRGIGKSLELYFTNEGAGPFTLYGWDVQYTGVEE